VHFATNMQPDATIREEQDTCKFAHVVQFACQESEWNRAIGHWQACEMHCLTCESMPDTDTLTGRSLIFEFKLTDWSLLHQLTEYGNDFFWNKLIIKSSSLAQDMISYELH
jgi:hypothetical protein